MKAVITHAAIYTTDIEKMKAYYIKYFDGISNDRYTNSNGFSSYFISFASGSRLEIMHHTELTKRPVTDKINGWNHLAFSVGSKDAVIKLTEVIISDGYELFSPPRETGDGYFESCVSDPDGNRIEITV